MMKPDNISMIMCMESSCAYVHEAESVIGIGKEAIEVVHGK